MLHIEILLETVLDTVGYKLNKMEIIPTHFLQALHCSYMIFLIVNSVSS